MSNAIRCIDHRFAFKNYAIACLALIFNLSYLRSTILHPKKQCETVQVIWRFIYCFFRILIRTYGWVVKAGRRQSGDMGSIPVRFWILLRAAGHWARHCTDTCAVYIAAISIIFVSWISSVVISRWQGLTLNMNIILPLFWSTWSRARGQDSATCLAHGRDCSYCRASELK